MASNDPWIDVTIPEASYDMPLFWWVRARAANPDDLDGHWSVVRQFMIDTSIQLVFLPIVLNEDGGTQAPAALVDPYPPPGNEPSTLPTSTPNPYP